MNIHYLLLLVKMNVTPNVSYGDSFREKHGEALDIFDQLINKLCNRTV